MAIDTNICVKCLAVTGMLTAKHTHYDITVTVTEALPYVVTQTLRYNNKICTISTSLHNPV